VDQLIFVFGKERNRRSPGLILSPSDFLHTSQNLPGTREEREGVWQMRAGVQVDQFSLDLVHLPVKEVSASGMPKDGASQARGSLLRFFGRLPGGVDLGVDVGRDNGSLKKGAFVQTIVLDVLKPYVEWGYDGATRSDSSLVGVSYEGLPDAAIRGEIYQQSALWQNISPLFKDQSYGILSVSVAEWLNRFNLTESLIRSLQTNSYANILRAEWLLSSRNVVGARLQYAVQGPTEQWQSSLDFKTNF
jgi:hypothetical protein